MTEQEEIREEIQRLWCQHCKAMQKTNNTVVECWYNPLNHDREKAFCASNVDAVDAILKAESDKGVVIKVDGELPNDKNFYGVAKDNMAAGCYYHGQIDMKEAGYEAVESLI